MQLSHRDHRMDATIARGFAAWLVLIGGVTVLALVVPVPLVGVLGLVVLAIAGGAYIVTSGRALDAYERDLRTVRDGGPASGWLRAETSSARALDPSIGLPTGRSPHARPPRRAGDRTPPGRLPD